MRHRFVRGAVLAAVVAACWPSGAAAQEGGFMPSPNSGPPVIPIPTGQSGEPGFYFGAEFVMLKQTRALGTQTIAYRGFLDATGLITGVPGAFIGTGRDALRTDQLGSRTFMPGHLTEIGYKFDTGTRIYVNYMQFYGAQYSAGATSVPAGFRVTPSLADTFITSPVFGFPPQMAGPEEDISADAAGNGFRAYGVWNAADTMDIKFTQRYTQAEAGFRVPCFATDYSRIYTMAGARFAWFFERFNWRTTDYAADGTGDPAFAAEYSNTLSQRMYGAFVGLGHEVYLGDWLSLSVDLTAAAYMNIVKERAKYKRRDELVQSKFGRERFELTPSVTGQVNLWWYPIEGVQLRLGYQGITFFNTRYMREPVGFNWGNIDPMYGTKWFRLLHGFNVGVGFFF